MTLGEQDSSHSKQGSSKWNGHADVKRPRLMASTVAKDWTNDHHNMANNPKSEVHSAPGTGQCLLAIIPAEDIQSPTPNSQTILSIPDKMITKYGLCKA